MTRRIAITGASGFLGSFLIPRLRAAGHTALPVSRADVDFADPDAVTSFLSAREATDIIHLAAQANPADGDFRRFYADNAYLTLALLNGCRQAGLPGRFVHVSATSVYGQTDGIVTEDRELRPLNHYAASKVLAETFVGWQSPDLDVAIARPSNCIGRGQKQFYLVPKLVAAFRERAPVIRLGEIDIARDFVDVRDAVDILARLVEADRPPAIVNVSSGRATRIRDIIAILSDLTGHVPNIDRDESLVRSGDIKFQACSNDAARSIGHSPAYSLADTLAWMLEAPANSGLPKGDTTP